MENIQPLTVALNRALGSIWVNVRDEKRIANLRLPDYRNAWFAEYEQRIGKSSDESAFVTTREGQAIIVPNEYTFIRVMPSYTSNDGVIIIAFENKYRDVCRITIECKDGQDVLASIEAGSAEPTRAMLLNISSLDVAFDRRLRTQVLAADRDESLDLDLARLFKRVVGMDTEMILKRIEQERAKTIENDRVVELLARYDKV